MLAWMKYWIDLSKYNVMQAYFHLQYYDQLPFQLMHQDYEDRRTLLVPPRKPQGRKAA